MPQTLFPSQTATMSPLYAKIPLPVVINGDI